MFKIIVLLTVISIAIALLIILIFYIAYRLLRFIADMEAEATEYEFTMPYDGIPEECI